VDVQEMIGCIIAEPMVMPWEYYRRHVTRQLWDEREHAMLGELGLKIRRGLAKECIDQFHMVVALNTQLKPTSNVTRFYIS
jgi:hypothetical protein